MSNYDDWKQTFVDEGKCHICEGTGEVWELGPGYDGEEDLIQVPCPRCKNELSKTGQGSTELHGLSQAARRHHRPGPSQS